MAGAGYKLFNTGDVLTAAQVNTYLNEQTVMVFASSAARTTALSGVLAEGMVSYLKDTNFVEYYDGSSWIALASGDLTAITAGTGITVTNGTGPIPTVAIDSTVATLTGTQTLTNKTLTAPKFADLGFIADANGNELIILDTVASAVNEITVANAATGTAPTITASGETNVSLNLVPKGTGTVQAGGVPVVTTTGTQTLTNKTLTSPVLTTPTISTIDAKGDLLVGTADNTIARLAVGGTNGHTLQVDSSTATGLKWAAAAGAASFAGASAYKSANQNIDSDTYTAITFNSEDFDTDAYHDTSSNTSRFTIPSGKGGKYLLSGAVGWAASNAGTFRLVVVYKNGSIFNQIAQFAGTNDGTIQPFACVYDLVATDYLEVFVRHNTGGTLAVQGGVQQTRAQVSYLGA